MDPIPFRQNLDLINALLAKMTDDPKRAPKAYALGLICALAEIDGVVAPDEVLNAAAGCETVADAIKLYQAFRDLRKAGA